MAGEGMQIAVMPHQFNLMSRAFIKNKGINLSLSSPEVEANAVEGEGIFGKKADKFFEKKGIKKIIYKTGAALKPLAMEAIDTAAQMAEAYGVPPALVNMAKKETTGYINDPDSYQTKKGQNALLKRVGKTAMEVGSPYMEDMGIDVQQVKDAAKLARDMKKGTNSSGPPVTRASIRNDSEEAFLSTLQAYMDKRASSAPAKIQSTSPYDLMDRDGIIGNGIIQKMRKQQRQRNVAVARQMDGGSMIGELRRDLRERHGDNVAVARQMDGGSMIGELRRDLRERHDDKMSEMQGVGLYAGSAGRGLGMGIYAGGSLTSSLRDMGKRYVNQSRSMVGMGHPALESQHDDANFLSRNQMPPAWQRPR
jgi:hypothetical protein